MPNAAPSSREAGPSGSLDAAIACAVFLGSLVYFQSTLHLTLELRDEGYIFFNIARAAHGEVPHRDFIDTYGPGVYALTAPVFDFFGERVLPVRWLMAAIRAGGVACAYLIARALTPRSFALLAAVVAAAFWGRSTYFINVPYAVFFTIPLCMASLALLLRGEARGGRAAYFGSGLLCGAGLLFKWSLAAVSAYGMMLAIAASALLREPPTPGARGGRILLVAGAVAAGAAIVAPFVTILSPFEYLLHFAPIHALLVLLAVRGYRHGDAAAAFVRAAPRLLRYLAGFVLPPLGVAAVYLAWGSLDVLLYDVVLRPMQYRGYHTPIVAPPFEKLALLLALGAGVTAGLAWLGSARRIAIPLSVLAALLAVFGVRSLSGDGNTSLVLQDLGLVLPALLSGAALVLLAVHLARPQPLDTDRWLAALVAVLLFQEMMTFEIFPRGDNVTAMAGVLAPLLAALAHRGFRLAGGTEPTAGAGRRALAFALAAALPLLMVAEGVRSTLTQPSDRDLAKNALFAPALAGILPKPKLYRGQHLAEFDALVARLSRPPFAEGPLFVVPNEPMIYFVTGHEPLFPEHTYTLFLAGWGLLPENDPQAPHESELIARLKKNPAAVVVMREPDPTTGNLFAEYPGLETFLRESFRNEATIGRYRVLRRRTHDRSDP